MATKKKAVKKAAPKKKSKFVKKPKGKSAPDVSALNEEEDGDKGKDRPITRPPNP